MLCNTLFSLMFSTWTLMSFAATPEEKKAMAKEQVDIMVKMAKEFKILAERLPTTDSLKQQIREIDAAELFKINKGIGDELRKRPVQRCRLPTYTRDYSAHCPHQWLLMDDGQCWGRNYHGDCEALFYTSTLNEDDKRNFEMRCCAFWPEKETLKTKLYRGKKKKILSSVPPSATHGKLKLHGPVDSDTGLVIS